MKVQFVNWGTEMTVTAPKGQTELVSGSKLQLTAAVTGVKVKNFLWYVDKPEAATVSKGKVTALKVYENTPITVTAIADDGSGLKATFDILIKPSKTETLHIKLGDQVITGSTQYMRVGDTRELSVWVYDPDEGSWKTVDGMLELSGKGVKQEGSTFTATAVGKKTDKATVTAKYGKLKAAITLKVVNPAESITLSEKKDTFHTVPGKSLNFTAKIQGEGGAAATMDTVIWSVDNTAAATISAKGVLKAAKTVTEKTVVKVTATAADGFGASTTREVTIYPMATAILVHVQKVDEEGQPMGSVQTLNQCIREFRVGDRLALDADVFPQGAMDAVSWDIGKSKNAMLTTGEDGTPVITLLKKGTLTIKACLQDGSGGKVTVKIKIVE